MNTIVNDGEFAEKFQLQVGIKIWLNNGKYRTCKILF